MFSFSLSLVSGLCTQELVGYSDLFKYQFDMFCSVKTCLHIYVSLNIFKYSLKHKCIITDTREPVPVREAIFSAAVLKTVKQYFNLVHINRDIIKIIIP